MKEILIYVEKGYADWEISHIGFQVKSSGKYDVKVVSKTKDPLVSMSGMRIIPDYSADEIFKSNISNYPMLILCGGMFWSQAGFVNDTAKKLVDLFLKNNKYVGAICDATTFLAYNNYVNGVRHTGNTIENNIRSCPNYQGHMWYIDLVNGSDEYRGVYFTSYRPYSTSYTSSTDNSYQDDNGYSTSNVYWFKYEPITWRVLDVQAGKAFLMANLVLDSQDYHYSTFTRTIGGSTVYSNNYKESHIRSWLNDSFYNTAFSTEEKARIQTTTVDNSFASTGYSSNTYACANTSDKVFLLSYAEATSATYGLSTTTSRQLGPSAYAKAQGVYTNTNGFNLWWLRSPDDSDRVNNARIVSYVGSFTYNGVYRTYGGVVPALWISL